MSNATDTQRFASDGYSLVLGLLRFGDVVTVGISAVLAFWIRLGSFDMPFYYEASILLAAVLSLNYMQVAGVYRLIAVERLTTHLFQTTIAWFAVLLTLVGVAYFTNTTDWFNRDWVELWSGLAVTGFIAVRLGAIIQLWRMRQQGALSVNIAVVGAGDLGQAVIRHLREDPRSDLRVVGVFENRTPRPLEIEGCAVLGTVDDLIDLARRQRIDEIILAMVDRSGEEIAEVLSMLRLIPVNTKLCAHSLRFNMPVRGFTALAGLPLLHVYERPLRGWHGIWKGLEDRLLGIIILTLMAPIMLIIAALVRLDSPGPILFRQKRYGFNNDPITVFKFRSMYYQPVPDAAVRQARRADPRITKIGGFLRRTSLDELPQLFNVLRGEMSLVGPRPHAVAHNEEYAKIIDGYLGRHRVKPGITGWAQVNGARGETDTPEKMRIRVQYDLHYIDNWSLFFDIKILLLTIIVGFVNRNAY